MKSLTAYQEIIALHIAQVAKQETPINLYQPINYILNLGGKRLRPILTLMTAEVFQCKADKAISAALCVEVFHNFTLVHDDIMDQAPLRRGKATIHHKWNVNTGILSGDTMLILAYQYLESYPDTTFKTLISLFSKTAIEVCEGQQMDIDFATRPIVSDLEYLKMISYKTAVLIGAAMQMGAIVANASQKEQRGIYEFGKNLGIAFQLQDDYLDIFGDAETIGKQIGGDIIENKKTYLYIKALELASEKDKKQLGLLFSTKTTNSEEKIAFTKHVFETSGAAKATKTAIELYTQKAFEELETLEIYNEQKEYLKVFGTQLMDRKL